MVQTLNFPTRYQRILNKKTIIQESQRKMNFLSLQISMQAWMHFKNFQRPGARKNPKSFNLSPNSPRRSLSLRMKILCKTQLLKTNKQFVARTHKIGYNSPSDRASPTGRISLRKRMKMKIGSTRITRTFNKHNQKFK